MTIEIFEQAMDSIVKGDAGLAEEAARKGLGEGIDPIELINKGFIPGINKVGELFGMGTLFLPELIQSATAMQPATDMINDAIPGVSKKSAKTCGCHCSMPTDCK